MTDPLGLIGNAGFDRPVQPTPLGREQRNGPGFQKLLQDKIEQVNKLQQDATEAIEDLAAGRRDDVESVLIATRKADTAFHLLLQVRNKVVDAYDEVKQMRV